MYIKILNEPNHKPSAFLTFSKPIDLFKAQSDVTNVKFSYLRVELARIRAGMQDYIIRVATPKVEGKKSNVIVTLRGNHSLASGEGLLNTAKVIGEQMQKRGDTTFNWENLNIEHLSKMLQPYMKFFASNSSIENMQFITEALL